MSTAHARFAEWDAAYVIGALSPSDRRDFEDHLAECDECRRAVADLLPTVGLLSRVTAERATSIHDDPAIVGEADAVARAGLASLARRRARRRRGIRIGLVAAGVLAVAAIAVPVALAVTDASAPGYALEDVADAPLEASVRLTPAAWGTRIDLQCGYTTPPGDTPIGGWPYALDVVDASGTATTVSTWRAVPGSTAQVSAGTALDEDEIAAIEIRTVDGDRVLMRYTPRG